LVSSVHIFPYSTPVSEPSAYKTLRHNTYEVHIMVQVRVYFRTRRQQLSATLIRIWPWLRYTCIWPTARELAEVAQCPCVLCYTQVWHSTFVVAPLSSVSIVPFSKSEPPPFIFLTYFSYFERIKVGLWDHVAVCVCVFVCVSPPIASRQRLGKSPLIVARQRLGKKSTYRC
jgi:hypothetical protein